jgi:hypothetical protein
MYRSTATKSHDRGNVAGTGTEMDAIATYISGITDACPAKAP